jgi:hypothetical protein
LGGDVYRLTPRTRNKFVVYYVCAVEFGWDKRTVDKQPLDYLRKLIAFHTEEKRKEAASMKQASKKSF